MTKHLVYINLSDPQEMPAVAQEAGRLETPFDFAVVQSDADAPPDDVELAFSVEADTIEEAMGRAGELYAGARERAGLPADPNARITAGEWPAS